MGIEYELKYRATAEVLEQLLQTLSGQVQHFEMRTAYYDTADGQLSARRWTLRRRMENQLSVCTLKTPGADGARSEFEVECPDILQALPILCKLSNLPELAQLTAPGVQEVCGASFHRIAVTVQLDGAVAEVALDRGVLLGGGKELPLCEVEVELKDGSEAVVSAYGADLSKRFGMEPESQSKFRRAALLAGGN